MVQAGQVSGPRVLFVSKPIVPPWHDGSKNLVRDVASHLTRAVPTVLTTPTAPPVAEVRCEPVYRSSGSFAPGVMANARVLARLISGDPQDLWHFVFAPNPASSGAARFARGVRRTLGWRGKIVQTVASAPASFERVSELLFGDAVVVLSEWTRGRLVGAGVSSSLLRVIPPCAAAPPAPSAQRIQAARERFALGDAKVVLYPGDYEVSSGAETFALSIPVVAKEVPDAVFVYACREKTSRAAEARARVSDRIKESGVSDRVRHVGEIDDLPALMATSSVVAFPVDELYGKVDLPLVLLEALALGVPLVLARGGPLEAIPTAAFVDPKDANALAEELTLSLTNDAARAAQAAAGKELYASHFTPDKVAAQYDDLYEEVLKGALEETL